ncbi:MAG: GTP pyrophosphokinase family protein [Bacteroidales bacterium]|nr:GTP pyrophosphokinase family protein [Lachnoclostridium sp.]MCM1385582.1 GTP pyrophosphokinase family protein [Lachnoclostridium sp.]MCM1465583.1 GTP pyrophosphokinase family protein [Bacteroidales bacterium]
MDGKSEIILNKEQLDKFQDNIAGFRNLMMEYRCAMLEVQTKLEVLNKELSLLHSRNPFESIKSRLKSPESIMEKLDRNGLEYTVENIEKNLNDIAGIRVICSFAEDIYMLVDCLVAQDDIILVEKKDYIKNPKPNGYRSLHLILDIPIFLTKEKKHMRVEVQFRTIAMDFWASLEHKLKYKKDIENAESISEELKYCADIISQLDRRMEQIRNRIDNQVTYS